jgi:hypothetical protein
MQPSAVATCHGLRATLSMQLANHDERHTMSDGLRWKTLAGQAISKPPCDPSESEMTSQVAYWHGLVSQRTKSSTPQPSLIMAQNVRPTALQGFATSNQAAGYSLRGYTMPWA